MGVAEIDRKRLRILMHDQREKRKEGVNMISEKIQYMLWCYLGAVNLAAFAAYGWDKTKAKRKQWRISEKSLLLLAAIGGSLGAFLGMHVFHHKTRKLKFSMGMPILLLVHAAILIGVFILTYPDALAKITILGL